MSKFYCNHCSQRIEVRDVYAGQSFVCPTCNGELRVPEMTAPNPGNSAADRKFSIDKFYFSFDGRISVEDYWLRGVFVLLPIGVIAFIVDRALDANGIIYALFFLASIWIGAALLVKRWHDRNKSGWYYWILFIPLIGPFWTLIEACCMKGTKGDNRYGPDPIRKRR